MASSIRVMAVATQIMKRYDRNDDGFIDLKGKDRAYDARKTSEAVVVNRTIDWEWQESGGSYYRYAETFSHDRADLSKLFRAADTNQDQRVERDELLGLIRLFDENGDDRIGHERDNHWSELRQLKREYPEVRTESAYKLRFKEGKMVDPYTHNVELDGDIYDLTKHRHH